MTERRAMREYILLALAIAVAPFFLGEPAMAQATRTWVSGVGDDANPCSRTAPCKTWAGAIAKTTPGGEIDALDPGGFGALTITKSITLDGGGGQVASVLVSGTNGITVAAGTTDVVILRNLRFNGLLGNGTTGSSGLAGISLISGATLIVENCAIFGFNTAGISANLSAGATLNVIGTSIENSRIGISLSTTSGVLQGSIDHVTIQSIPANGTANTGTGILSTGGSVNFTITNSVITGTTTGVNAGSTSTRFNVDTSSVSNNTTALNASVSGAIIRAANNTLNNNTTNFSTTGTIQSAGNNRIGGGSGSPNTTYTQQ